MHVEAYPAENSKSVTNLLLESGGGPAANAAWLLSKWGVPTVFAGVVGDDEYGRKAVNELTSAGVDCRLVEERKNHATPVSFIVVNRATGSRTIINRKTRGAGLRVTGDRLQGLEPELLLFDGHELQASLVAMKTFPGAITVLDAGSLRKGTASLAPKVRYLVCSERFAAQVTGETGLPRQWRRCVQRLHRRYRTTVVVTMGSGGSAFDDGHVSGHVPALPVNAQDTTAAGDIFHGAFAFALLRKLELQKSLELATVAAGLSVLRPGGRHSIPPLSAVLKKLSYG